MKEKQRLAQSEVPQNDNLNPPSFTESKSLENGTSASVVPFRTNFACVSLHMTDRIRLIKFPPDDVVRVQEVIRQSWAKGIQETRPYDVSKEIKVRGNPWKSTGWSQQDKFDARRLVRCLLAGLFDMGWVLKASVDVSKKRFDKDSLLFRLQQPAPPPCDWMSISFDNGDLLDLIDTPPNLGESIVTALGSRVQRHEDHGNFFRIKLRGYPWRCNGTETVQTRVILLILLECLEEHGFSLYAAIDQDNGPSGDNHATEADVWVCNRQKDWMPGAPIYHK